MTKTIRRPRSLDDERRFSQVRIVGSGVEPRPVDHVTPAPSRRMGTISRLLLLTVLLNLARYFVGGLIEQVTVMPRLVAAMAASPTYFDTAFTPTHWASSFAYNFAMWLTTVIAFHLMRPRLGDGRWLPSLKGFGLMYAGFASVSAIYMNHYSHPKSFYVYSIADGAIAFGVVAVANALLYPRLVERQPYRPPGPSIAASQDAR